MFERILSKIAEALTTHKIPYMVIGVQAVLRYGEPRLTKDIDITLGLGVEGLQMIKAVTTSLALRILVEDAEAFVRKTMVLPSADRFGNRSAAGWVVRRVHSLRCPEAASLTAEGLPMAAV